MNHELTTARRLLIVVAMVAIASAIWLLSVVEGAIAPAGKFTRLSLPITNIQDTMESYATDVFVNGLNGGTGWQTPWMGAQNILGIQGGDDIQSVFYTNTSPVNGLNKGFGFASAWMDMDSQVTGFYGADSMESYANGVSINGLNGNTTLPNNRSEPWATGWMTDP